jgi:hypothetical protein
VEHEPDLVPRFPVLAVDDLHAETPEPTVEAISERVPRRRDDLQHRVGPVTTFHETDASLHLLPLSFAGFALRDERVSCCQQSKAPATTFRSFRQMHPTSAHIRMLGPFEGSKGIEITPHFRKSATHVMLLS